MTPFSTLASVPLFSKLRETDISLLASLLTQRDYEKNRVILFSYDPSDAFYVVLKGKVKVMLIAEDGREVVLSILREGDFFGESALLDDEPYAASAVALDDCTLAVLHREAFRRCVTEIPGMAFGLLRALCSRLRESDQKIGGLMLLDVAGRVSRLLLELASRGDGETIRDLPTHQVIAQMIGSTRETVSRTIGSLAASGLIQATNEGIKIVNKEALEREAGQVLRRRPAIRTGAPQQIRSQIYRRPLVHSLAR